MRSKWKIKISRKINKCLVNEVVEARFKLYTDKIKALKHRVKDITESQNSISDKYDKLKIDYENLKKTHSKQNKDLQSTKKKLGKLKQSSETELVRLENLEQYGKRQKHDFYGVPESENEDVSKLVVEISKLFGVEINQKDISSVARRLPAIIATKKARPTSSNRDICQPQCAQ